MVPQPHTVVDPGAVVVEPRHAAIAGLAVLGAERSAGQARGAERLAAEEAALTQLRYGLRGGEGCEEGGGEGVRVPGEG